MDFILILLQSDEPPTADAHGEESEESSQKDTPKPFTPTTACQGNEYPT